MVDFEDRINEIVDSREPSGIVHYIKELAGTFHSFYTNTKVLENQDLQKLVVAFYNLYSKLFNLLGIKPKEEM
jgi:arginyl-tRNA synthetase